MTDQRHRAACVLAGFNKISKCIAGIVAPRIPEYVSSGSSGNGSNGSSPSSGARHRQSSSTSPILHVMGLHVAKRFKEIVPLDPVDIMVLFE